MSKFCEAKGGQCDELRHAKARAWDAERDNERLQSRLHERTKLLRDIQKDLVSRAHMDSAGAKVVMLSASLWDRLDEAARPESGHSSTAEHVASNHETTGSTPAVRSISVQTEDGETVNYDVEGGDLNCSHPPSKWSVGMTSMKALCVCGARLRVRD